MRTAMCWSAATLGRAVCFVASVMVFTSTSVRAQINSWINPRSGNWDQPTNWSLGILPVSSQSVMITNGGFKAVAINPSTPINFPGSMTVSNLTIQGATNSGNLLLLNFFGIAVPLTVLNGLTLRDDGQILDLNSGLVVQGGTITVTNAQINQDGGFIHTMNATMSLQDSAYNLTNGAFEGGQVSLGNSVSAQFNQFGGTALITNLMFGISANGGNSGGGTYTLFGGNLNLPGGLTITGANNSASAYLQAGGTNQTGNVFLEAGDFGISPSFTLNGGVLADNGVTLQADEFGGSAITQNGGTHVITNSLSIFGGTGPDPSELHPGIYQLNVGTLSAGSISMDSSVGPASFNQTNGAASAGEIQGISNPLGSFWVSVVNLSGGTLTSSNIHMTDGSDINQSGGALAVSNSLAFDGFIFPGPTPLYSTYTLLGGTLTASNISVGGIWIIGNSTTNRITNPGTCTLSNRIVISNAVEQLGQFILGGTNATIDLAGGASQLKFANSSGQTWAGSATLTIMDWNGNPSGGGAEQLKFGTDQSGLTVGQLSQIQFAIGTNFFPAKILNTGEVVPNQGAAAGLVNSWITPVSGNWDVASNWSLGILPASSQSVMITNAGFKAVAIQPSTPTNFPGSMTVSNLTITAPSNSFNLLLMNFVGAGRPLVIGSSNTPGNLIIGSTNSSMVVYASGLLVNNALGTNNSRMGEFEVDGTFVQSVFSEIGAGFLDLNSTGTYDMTNGMLFIANQFINGTFNQFGGTNVGEVVFSDGGTYNQFGGVLNGSVDMAEPSAATFNQSGGTNISSLGLEGLGLYQLSGGLLVPGDLQVGPPELLPTSFGAGSVVQTGGTVNAGNITMGIGSYTLEGGVLTASNLALPTLSDRLGSFGSSFDQSGGFFTNGGVTMNGVFDLRNGLQPSTYTLSGGELKTPTVNMTLGLFNQSGGTNSVGVLTLGTNSSYDFTNGALIANNIQVEGQSTFVHAGGSFGGLDNILLAGGGWVERTAGEQLGQLQLGSGASSFLNLPSGACVLRFANSSSVTWASGAVLTIQNWSGSTNGGGSQQVFFGTSASGLTAQQLSQVRFSNPAGLPPGTFSARILSDGEVVPNQVIAASIAFSRQGNNLVLTWPTGWTLQSATNVVGPYSNVAGATSPYTNNMTMPHQFFVLRLN